MIARLPAAKKWKTSTMLEFAGEILIEGCIHVVGFATKVLLFGFYMIVHGCKGMVNFYRHIGMRDVDM